jgi:holo-[acyl-carrier protein] synthase
VSHEADTPAARQPAPPPRFGLGVDLITVGELDRLAERAWFTRFAFAESELAQADAMAGERRREFLAGRFAAKEAVLKALGSGLFQGVVPRDISLVRGPSGAPRVDLLATAGAAAAAAGIGQVTVSITHKAGLVAAVAAAW